MSEAVLSRVDGSPFRWVDERVLVLRRDGTVSRLGGSAALVWEIAALPVSRAEIVERAAELAPSTVAGSGAVEAWVTQAIDDMLGRGLLVERGAGD